MLCVHKASIQDRDSAKLVLEKLDPRFPSLELIWADGGYAGRLVEWTRQKTGLILEIVKRTTGFTVLPKPWIVERTFGWLGRYQRRAKDYEERTDNREAITNLMNRRLKE